MLTPPRHFSIPACPPRSTSTASDSPGSQCILYRGSIPEARNLAFLGRLQLRTIVVLAPKEPKETELVEVPDRRVTDEGGITALGNGVNGDRTRGAQRQRARLTPLGKLKRRDGVHVKWIKVDRMQEEKLGMGKGEVGDVLKMILDTSLYPLYIADLDGKSHTSLIIGCLRKLQGWHMDSIIRELERFEPEYDEYPFQTFLSSYLTGTSSEPLSLPAPPYPTWLWPSLSTSAAQPNANTGGQGASVGGAPAGASRSSNASAAATPTTASPGAGGGVVPLSRAGTISERGGRQATANAAAGGAGTEYASSAGSISAPGSAAPSRAGTLRDKDRPKAGTGDASGGSGSHTREESGTSVSTVDSESGPSTARGSTAARQGDVPAPTALTSLSFQAPRPASSSSSSSNTAPTATVTTSGRTRERERTVSSNSNLPSAEIILPFPHPQQARRHPTMKLTFPPPPAAPVNPALMSPLSRTNSRWEERREREGAKARDGDRDKTREERRSDAGKARDRDRERDRDRAKDGAGVERPGPGSVSNTGGRPSPGTSTTSPSPASPPFSPTSDTVMQAQAEGSVHGNSLLAAATSIVSSGIETLTRAISPPSRNQSTTSSLRSSPVKSQKVLSTDRQQGSVPPPPVFDSGDRSAGVDVTAAEADTDPNADPDATPRLPRSVSFKRQSSFSAPSSPGRRAGAGAGQQLFPVSGAGLLSGVDAERSHGISASGTAGPAQRTEIDLSSSPLEPATRLGSIDSTSQSAGEDGALDQRSPSDLPSTSVEEASDQDAERRIREPSAEYEEDYSDEYDEDDDDEDEDEDDDDDDEDDEAIAPTALHISALDLAGYG